MENHVETTNQDRSVISSTAAPTLKITRWYEGAANHFGVEVQEIANGGGWTSVVQMQAVRFLDFKRSCRKIAVSEIEFGYRTEEKCRGALAGLTRVETVELRGAA